MKIQNSYSPRTRRSPVPIILVVLILLLVGGIYAAWSAGGEREQVTVEKVISSEKLGQ